ncbi:glycosyltransferase family 4 protein [Labilibaculum sp.]|uniref:glycosyltransferase family 4 protein n=1 Tax=Labilibaculum sp. TaxID=2060723 RepID=UPI003566DFC1
MHIGISGPIYIPSINIQYTGDRSKWPVGMGGVPVNHLINALLELGHKVSVFSSSPEIKVGDSFEWHEDNISIYLGPFRDRAKHRCLDFFAVERDYITKAIVQAQPDFVHAHWQYEWAWATLDSGLPTLVTCHDSPWHVFKAQTDFYRFFRMIMAAIVLFKSEKLTTVSETCAIGLKKLTSKKIQIIPNFEPDEVFGFYESITKKEESRCIAMINNGFTSLKNVEVGIEAFIRLREKNSNVELHLFGSSFGVNEKAYTWCRGRFDIENIHFHGSLPFKELMQCLSGMDIFLHTSLQESFGMVLVEAMAMGIPVIAGKSSGGPEWILKDGGGLLVDVSSVDAVKNALINLMYSKEYNKFSVKAREVALSRFSKSKVVDLYLDAYKELN